jgi:hypothetical protein
MIDKGPYTAVQYGWTAIDANDDRALDAAFGVTNAPQDPMLNGCMLAAYREGETAMPLVEAEAIALGLLYRDGMGSLCLTAAGRRHLRKAGLIR